MDFGPGMDIFCQLYIGVGIGGARWATGPPTFLVLSGGPLQTTNKNTSNCDEWHKRDSANRGSDKRWDPYSGRSPEVKLRAP